MVVIFDLREENLIETDNSKLIQQKEEIIHNGMGNNKKQN